MHRDGPLSVISLGGESAINKILPTDNRGAFGDHGDSGSVNVNKVPPRLCVQGVPYYWAHFVFVIFSGSREHTEELFIAIG